MARYTIERRIGEGGMAEVFRARAEGDAGFTRAVAIKRLLPEFAQDARVQARFVDEARITSKLRHPNIVAVTDFYEANGVQHLVMELVEGVSVERLVERGRAGRFLPLSVVARIAYESARAVEFAHAEGVLHRDISCCNLLVSRAGEVKLGDFGLADARGRVSSTAPGEIAGKEAYMSPQRRAGAKATPLDDLYALGVVLDSLLGATDPRTRSGPDGAELAAIAPRLCARDPAARVPSASALVALLRPAARASADTLGAIVQDEPAARAKAPAPTKATRASPRPPPPKLRADELLAPTDRGERPPVKGPDDEPTTQVAWGPRTRVVALTVAVLALVTILVVLSR